MKANPTSYDTPIAPRKLKLLVTVVNREKAEFYTDFIQSFDSYCQGIHRHPHPPRQTGSGRVLRTLRSGSDE